MAVGESAGTLFVTIDGDTSPILAQYQKAEAQSRAAGQRIAAGLGVGLQQGSQQLAIFNALLAQSGTEEGKAAQAALQLGTALKGVGADAGTAAPQIVEVAAATEAVAVASTHAVTEIQAVSGAIRTFDGNGGIRAAERFIATTLGVGPAMQAIFPIVGAIALTEILVKTGEKVVKLADNFFYLRDAEEEAGKIGKDTGEAIEKSLERQRDLVVQILRLKGQPVLAEQEEKFNISQRPIKLLEPDKDKLSGLDEDQLATIKSAFADVLPADISDRIHNVKNDLEDATAALKVAKASPFIENDADVTVKLLTNSLQVLKQKRDEYDAETATADAKIGKTQTDEDKKQADAAKRALTERRQAFKDSYDNQFADLKAAHDVTRAEELKFRQDELNDAKSRGPGFAPVATEVNRQVGTLSQEVRKEDSEGSKRLAEAQFTYASNLRKEALADFEADGRLMDKAVEEITKQMERAATMRKSAADTADRSNRQAGQYLDVTASGVAESRKLQIEIAYGAQITHTRQQEIQYAEQLAQIENDLMQSKLTVAQQEVSDAQAAYAINQSAGELLKWQAAITAEKKAQNNLDNQTLKNNLIIAKVGKRESLGMDLNSDLQQVAPSLSGALSNGIMNGGKGIAQDITNAMKGIGSKILNDVFLKLIEQLGVNAAIDAITNSLGLTHITAQTAQTTATVANTAALVASTATTGAGAAAGVGGAVASVASTAATGAVSSIVGPVIGGIVSGVISAAATFIGDAAIVKAIHGTTAAVMTLRPGGIGGQVGTGTPSQSQISAPSTSFIASIGAGLFQSLTGAGALPVKLMAINPGILMASALSIFGFASGGRPAPGVPYIVGENGPELRIDDGPGIILPNVPSFSSGIGSSMLTSSMVSNSNSQAMSIGAIHLHGVTNVEEFARRLPNVLKARSPQFSPATR